MKCSQVLELLPLYVGRDLEEKPSALVAEHLQTCAECTVSESEYRSTMQMIHQFSPPPFDEAVYAEIRRLVLNEIDQRSTAMTLSQQIANLFRPGMRWAFAATLLVVSVASFYFVVDRTTNRPQVTDIRSADRPAIEERSNTLVEVEPLASPLPLDQQKNGPSALRSQWTKSAHLTTKVDATHLAQQKKRPVPVDDRGKSVTPRLDPRQKIPGTIPPSDNLAGITEPAASDRTLRMEMQTRDPNIRIIWFAAQPAKQNSRN